MKLKLNDVFLQRRLLSARKAEKAAKRAIGLMNKLNPSPTKSKNASRIFKNLVFIRKLVKLYENHYRDIDHVS